MNVQKYNKAYVPTIVAIVLVITSHFGFTPEMTLEQVLTVLITGVLTSLGVYQVPNKK